MRLSLSAALVAAAGFAALGTARAAIVERIVAVVGDRPILKTDLETRSRPFVFQVMQKVPTGAQQTAAISQLNKELLEKMIDEELETQAAARAKITVTSEEIDGGLRNIAASQNMSLT